MQTTLCSDIFAHINNFLLKRNSPILRFTNEIVIYIFEVFFAVIFLTFGILFYLEASKKHLLIMIGGTPNQ